MKLVKGEVRCFQLHSIILVLLISRHVMGWFISVAKSLVIINKVKLLIFSILVIPSLSSPSCLVAGRISCSDWFC
ncbi:unnamed protein product [Trifolium pratense]|uniref:Uncharacterized protein n=1 Tax=Trifolium pratense TaxID=57577 RepID=A0ACB0KJ14_TRIPR|nr:unnamed protein product [Trifolium pratense]